MYKQLGLQDIAVRRRCGMGIQVTWKYASPTMYKAASKQG
jgi:hypothetical protein